MLNWAQGNVQRSITVNGYRVDFSSDLSREPAQYHYSICSGTDVVLHNGAAESPEAAHRAALEWIEQIETSRREQAG